MGTEANRWMGVMGEVCGCSLLIDFIFPVKWEVRSSDDGWDRYWSCRRSGRSK